MSDSCEKEEDDHALFDMRSFATFERLLEACQEYAKLTGSRFLKGTLKSLDENASDSNEAVVVLQKSASVVEEFRSRLAARDQDLMQDLKYAYQQCMTESVRNGVVATCRQLDLWPPRPSPAHIPDGDCSWQDTSAPLPEIAQRAFNDELQRGNNQLLKPLQLKATTASFIADFAADVGAASELASPTDMHKEQLTEFMLRVDEWVEKVEKARQSADPMPLAKVAREAFLKGLGPGGVADNMRQQVRARWTKNWESPEGTLANMALIGLAAVSVAAAVHRGVKGRK